MADDRFKIAEITAFSTAAAFLCGIAHSFGLAFFLGFDILQYFTIKDYLTQAVPWLPFALLVSGSALVVNRIFRGIRRRQDAKPPTEKAPSMRRTVVSLVLLPSVLVVFVGALTIMVIELIRRKEFALLIGSCTGFAVASWLAVAEWYLARRRSWSATYIAVFTLLPALVLASLSFGLIRGVDVGKDTSRTMIFSTDGRQFQGQTILRLESYLLVREQDGSTTLINASDFRSMKTAPTLPAVERHPPY